jgi:hypothetical protein
MKTPRGELDWQISLNRQVEFYRWLQSNEGAIAGGATNSVNGRYDQAPKDTSKFYGLSFENDPVYADPASNSWFGWQAWSMQRIAEYYAVTGDKNVEVLLDRWVTWALSHIKFDKQGGFLIPVTLEWSGQPYEWNPLSPQVNTQLKVRVTEYNQDVGIASALAKTLMFYAKGSATHRSQKQSSAIQSAKELLDRIWTQGRDPLGLSFEEVRKDYSRFSDPVFIPETFQGKMPSQAQVRKGSTFLSLRPQYKTDPEFAKIQRFLEGGEPPRFRYHRFWAQVEAALAFAEFDRLALD